MADSIVPLQGRQLSLLSKYNGDLILAMNFDIINPYSVFNNPSSIVLYSATPFIYLISIISCWFWWSCTIQTTQSCYSLTPCNTTPFCAPWSSEIQFHLTVFLFLFKFYHESPCKNVLIFARNVIISSLKRASSTHFLYTNRPPSNVPKTLQLFPWKYSIILKWSFLNEFDWPLWSLIVKWPNRIPFLFCLKKNSYWLPMSRIHYNNLFLPPLKHFKWVLVTSGYFRIPWSVWSLSIWSPDT